MATVTAYFFDPFTQEYSHSAEYELLPGGGLPPELFGYYTLVEPELLPGLKYYYMYDTQSWQGRIDNRGLYWNKFTGQSVNFQDFGPVPTYLTNIPIPDRWHTWDDATGGWIITPANVEARAQAKRDEIKMSVEGRVLAYINDVAATRKYDGIVSLCSYAASTIDKFAAEGQAGIAFRDAVWAKCYEMEGLVDNGTITEIPTDAELMALLPKMTWPTGAAE